MSAAKIYCLRRKKSSPPVEEYPQGEVVCDAGASHPFALGPGLRRDDYYLELSAKKYNLLTTRRHVFYNFRC